MNTKVELPAMIDSETRLDSIILNENVITYHYTLVNLNKSQSQYLDFQSLNNNFKNRMCSTQLLRKALNEGGAFSTSYYGVDGEFFNSFSVSEKSCSR